jgi:phosphate transport system substrate-binding protein
MTRKILALALAALALAIAPAAAGATTLIGSGSTAAQPFFLALFKGYHKVKPSIKFVYTADGGNAGVKDVQQGRSQFAGQARLPLPSDAGTTYVKEFLDGLCLVVNPVNTLSNLTIQRTSDIYSGLLTNWGQIPGSNLRQTIHAVGRDSNGGTYNFFSSAIIGGKAPASNVTPFTSDGLVANAVKSDRTAIGYNGLAYVKKGSGLKPVKLNGIACSAANVKTLKYPLSRYLFIVLPTASPNPAVQKFADWVRTSPEAGAIITKLGGVPAFNKKAPVKKKAKPKRKTHHKR